MWVLLDFEGVQKHGLAARDTTEFPLGLPVLWDTDPLFLHYFRIGAGGGGGTAQVARHTVTYE